VKKRVAKKILKNQHRQRPMRRQTDGSYLASRPVYSDQQKNLAAHRLFRPACRHGDAKLAWAALKLKPDNSFTVDDQVDLKYEWLKGQELRREKLTISTKDIVPPPPVAKPAFRRDGQVHNFGAIPFPGQERKQPSLARYQVRDQNRRARPKHSVADFANMTQDDRPNENGVVDNTWNPPAPNT
jgi:hypothetical protein